MSLISAERMLPLLRRITEEAPPEIILDEILIDHYRENVAPTAELRTRIASQMPRCLDSWRQAATFSHIPFLQWVRNRVAETPRPKRDAVRRMLEIVLNQNNLSDEERELFSAITPLLSPSPINTALLDIPDGHPVDPIALTALFAHHKEAPPMTAKAIAAWAENQNRRSETIETTINGLFGQFSPKAQSRLTVSLLDNWSASSLPALTLSSLPELPERLRSMLISALRKTYDPNEKALPEAVAICAALPQAEAQALNNLREARIGDAEIAIIQNPITRPIAWDIVERITRTSPGQYIGDDELLALFRLLDKNAPDGFRLWLQSSSDSRKRLFTAMSVDQRADTLLQFALRASDRKDAQSAAGVVSATQVREAVSWLYQNGFKEEVHAALKGGGKYRSSPYHSQALWDAYLSIASPEVLRETCSPVKLASSTQDYSYPFEDSWCLSLTKALSSDEFRRNFADKIYSGVPDEDRAELLSKFLGEIPERNYGEKVAIHRQLFFCVAEAFGSEGRQVLGKAFAALELSRWDSPLDTLGYSYYLEMQRRKWPTEDIVALPPPQDSARLEVTLLSLRPEEIEQYGNRLITGSENLTGNADNDYTKSPWYILATLTGLSAETQECLINLGKSVPEVGGKLFDAAPIRFQEMAQYARFEDLLRHIGVRFECVRALSKRNLDDAQRESVQEAAQLLSDRSITRIALELALTFGMDLAPSFYRLTHQAWENQYNEKGSVFDDLYHTWELPKKSGGKRTITAPDRELKYLQRRMLRGAFDRLLTPEEVGDSVHGFIPGRNIVTNALPHVGHELVVNADIASFFPSISYDLVLKAVARLNDLEGVSLCPAALRMVADLCCYKGALPTGAPTSPAIANLVLRRVDHALVTLCARKGVAYTRYADDLTFSGNGDARTLLPFLAKCLEELDLKLDPKKTNLFRRGRRQIVTGLVVNVKPNLPRRLRRRLRAAVHYQERGENLFWHDRPMSENELKGRIAFLHQVQPEEANRLRQRLGLPEFAEKTGSGGGEDQQ